MQDQQATIQVGLGLHQAGRLQEAERIYQQVLTVNPANSQALHLLGRIALQTGNIEAAAQLILTAVHNEPSNALFLNSQGEVNFAMRRLDEALASFEQALSIRPESAELLHNRGLVLQELKRYGEALASYEAALSIKADFAGALYSRGNTLLALGRYDEAIAAYDEAIRTKPDFAEAFGNRGNALKLLLRRDEALASFDQALSIKPDSAEILSNRGLLLHELDRCGEALESYDRALMVNPNYAAAFCNRGMALHALSRYDEALGSYGKALTIEPASALTRWNESLTRLMLGDFERGWEAYECRWDCNNPSTPKRDRGVPLWLGDADISGKRILLHAEQGLGDIIQFSRYVPLVAGQGAKVVLEVYATLKALMSDGLEADQVIVTGESPPEVDCHCPLMSLPRAFGTRLDTVPARVPYLRASSASVGKWQEILGPAKGPRVGIVWSSNPSNPIGRNKSIPLTQLLPLGNAGVDLISLQNELPAADEKALASGAQVLHFGRNLRDFSDTAALVSLLDLVISVDTAVAHLAGALGKPVWILLPHAADWRWLLGRDDSPWYPTARLFRQRKPAEWESVIGEVAKLLTNFSQFRAPWVQY